VFRQLYLFYDNNTIFSHSYALAFDEQQFKKINEVLREYIEQPVPNQFFHRPYSNFQIFYTHVSGVFYLIIADLVDKREYIEEVLDKIIKKFQELFPSPSEITANTSSRSQFLDFLNEIHYELHPKIAIIGPVGVGKTTIAEILKGPEEARSIMNFAQSYKVNISNLYFDLWDFQMKDNFSPLWNNFVRGSDLVVLIFDSSNYNTKTITHFINLRNAEAKFSKILALANKQDLENAEEPAKIQNELDLPVLGISLKDPDVKNNLIAVLADGLNLKKELPAEFGQLLKDAEDKAHKGVFTEAISNYRKLVQICKDYQDFSYLGTFEDRIKELVVLKKEKEKKEELEKRKIKAPQQIQFSDKVAVRTLPSLGDEKKTSKPSVTPIETTKPTKKRKLTASDIKIKIPPQPQSKPEETPTLKPQPKPEAAPKPIPKTQEEKLFYLIQEKNGNLSLELCKQYIEKMESNLQRPLTDEELQKAAEIYSTKQTI